MRVRDPWGSRHFSAARTRYTLGRRLHPKEVREVKTCSKCCEAKPRDQFPPRKQSPDGLHCWCRECNRSYLREYYLKNRPPLTREIAEIKDGKKVCHKCGVNKHLSEFHRQASGPGGRRTTCKACRKIEHRENPEPARLRVARARSKNPEYMRGWREANATRVAVHHLVRQRRQSSTLGVSLDYLEVVITKLRDEPCWYCGSAGGEVDHVVPLSRGGLHHPSNFAPCCRSCNASKGNKLVGEWVVPTSLPL